MIPLIELRGAIPVSQAFNPALPLLPSFCVCILGNLIPVPFIYLFARKVLLFGEKEKRLGWFSSFCSFCLERGKRAGDRLTANGTSSFRLFLGLALFVGIPLPGTGAWTGTLAASILDTGLARTVLSCISGLILAGVIMTVLTVVFKVALF